MFDFARKSAAELELFFREAGARRSISPQIIEKDFWVCWLLRLIFDDEELGGHLVFKGGTSLSKVFGLIQRFSEDIDLSVDPDWLGFTGELRPDAASSRSQFQRRARALEDACIARVRDRFRPALEGHIAEQLPGYSSSLTFEVDGATHSPVLLFAYPRTSGITGSLRPQVKLEFGSLYDQRPTGEHIITPLVAETFPAMFSTVNCTVVALEAERTFWEKATLLHAEYHRPLDKPAPLGISRHHYDLFCLSRSELGKNALSDTDLLDRVRAHKQTWFRSAWAHYETARPGSFRLAPSPERRRELKRDYRRMEDMFMTTPPDFEEILGQLEVTERQINGN